MLWNSERVPFFVFFDTCTQSVICIQASVICINLKALQHLTLILQLLANFVVGKVHHRLSVRISKSMVNHFQISDYIKAKH